MDDINEWFEAMETLRKFNIKAGVEGFYFTDGERLFNEVLETMKKEHPCPKCGNKFKFCILN